MAHKPENSSRSNPSFGRPIIRGTGEVINQESGPAPWELPKKERWALTYSGKKFYPYDLDRTEFCLIDIAVGLGRQSRYGGQTGAFYSVAQHSVLVSLFCGEYRLEGLMHDAAEAYIGDLLGPIKVGMPDYKRLEDGIMRHLASLFGFEWPLPPIVKKVDTAILANEVRDLMLVPTAFENLPEHPIAQLQHITPWSHDTAALGWLRMYEVVISERKTK